MDILSFSLHILAAAVMGTVIGLERQWRQHTAGLKTNALVALGAALFVSLPALLGDAPNSSRLVGQVVVGVGFLGGGLILREGLNVVGMNTAATLWCSAAVGALTGAGRPLEGLIGTVVILGLNLALKPVGDWLDRQLRTAKNVETMYRLRATCRAGHEEKVRAVLLGFVRERPKMVIQGLATQEVGGPERLCVTADIYSQQRDDRAVEDLMARVNADPDVSAVSWEKTSPK
jgi:putative Mg2+ transporter-C (MgtC) family protein